MNLKLEGWMTEGELRWLETVAETMESCAEVGSWKGRSTHALCTGCKGNVYAIDHWRGSREERDGPHKEATIRDIFPDFMANVGHFDNLRVRRGESTEIAPKLPIVDMVFIDGGHTYEEVLADLEAWAPKTLRLICGHDYHLPDVRRAVQHFAASISANPEVQVAADSIWYIKNPVRRKLMPATPTRGDVWIRYTLSLMRTMQYVTRYGVHFEFRTREGDSLVPRSRIALFAQFLSDPFATHLLWIDDDLRWKAEDVMNLLRCDKPVSCIVYPKKKDPISWPMNILPGTGDNLPYDPETGCFSIKDAPTGLLMIRRDAALQIVSAYPETRCMIDEGGWDAVVNQNTYAVFDCPVDSDGMYLSEDFGFCRRWQKLGGEIWMYPHAEVGHRGMKEYVGKIADMIVTSEPDAEKQNVLQRGGE